MRQEGTGRDAGDVPCPRPQVYVYPQMPCRWSTCMPARTARSILFMNPQEEEKEGEEEEEEEDEAGRTRNDLFVDGGFGNPLFSADEAVGGDDPGDAAERPRTGLYSTSQFALERLFHTALMRSPWYIAASPREANLFYVPYWPAHFIQDIYEQVTARVGEATAPQESRRRAPPRPRRGRAAPIGAGEGSHGGDGAMQDRDAWRMLSAPENTWWWQRHGVGGWRHLLVLAHCLREYVVARSAFMFPPPQQSEEAATSARKEGPTAEDATVRGLTYLTIEEDDFADIATAPDAVFPLTRRVSDIPRIVQRAAAIPYPSVYHHDHHRQRQGLLADTRESWSESGAPHIVLVVGREGVARTTPFLRKLRNEVNTHCERASRYCFVYPTYRMALASTMAPYANESALALRRTNPLFRPLAIAATANISRRDTRKVAVGIEHINARAFRQIVYGSLVEAYASATFCLQTPGDTLTRKGIFDGASLGCIPLLLHPQQVAQYAMHVPHHWSDVAVSVNWTFFALGPQRYKFVAQRIVYADPEDLEERPARSPNNAVPLLREVSVSSMANVFEKVHALPQRVIRRLQTNLRDLARSLQYSYRPTPPLRSATTRLDERTATAVAAAVPAADDGDDAFDATLKTLACAYEMAERHLDFQHKKVGAT